MVVTSSEYETSLSFINHSNYDKNCYIAYTEQRLNQLMPNRMKKKYELEYTINSSPRVLFNRLSTPGGLAEWFADDVNLRDGIYTFIWESSEQQAKVIQRKDNKYIRFRWLEEEDRESYFEFRLNQDELTGDVSLMITDFAEDDETSDAVDLWDTQVAELKHVIGL